MDSPILSKRSVRSFSVSIASLTEEMSEADLNTAFARMMDDMKLPKKARVGMLKLPRDRKLTLIKQHKIKSESRVETSGAEWAAKLYKPKTVTIRLLQQVIWFSSTLCTLIAYMIDVCAHSFV